MSEYRHTIQKTGFNGVSQDPSQTDSNAGSPSFLDRGLSIRNSAVIGIGYVSAKKVFGTGYKAIISEVGNTQLENTANILTKGLEYAGMGLVNPYLLLGKIAVDVGSYGIETAVASHNQDLDNEIISYDRGTRRKFGVSNYYG